MTMDSASATEDYFTQSSFRVRLEWGRRGARVAAARGDILVVVDVLSFSTAVATAIDRGALVRPCADQEEADSVAVEIGGEAAVHRLRAQREGGYSLSPLSFLHAGAGARVTLASPNGATCSRHAAVVPHLFAGALVNATAVGAAVDRLLAARERNATVVACGERWQTHSEDGELRFAIEDYLGAGAIIAAIGAEKSPEARLAEMAFRGARESIAEIIRDSGSGVELRAKGYGGDVDHAAKLDRYATVPKMREGMFEKMRDDEGLEG